MFKRLKYILALLIISTLTSCGTTLRLTSIEDPTKYRDVKIQKKKIQVREDYTFITSKKGTRHMIYHHIYNIDIIK